MEHVIDELLLFIFKLLNQRNMVRVKRTCRKWRRIIREGVENHLPVLEPKYMIRNAMHINLGMSKCLKSTDYKDREKWFLWACESGDKDLIIRGVKLNARKNKYANRGLYYSGRMDLFSRLKIKPNPRYALLGAAKSGNSDLFRKIYKSDVPIKYIYDSVKLMVKYDNEDVLYFIINAQNSDKHELSGILNVMLTYAILYEKTELAIKYIRRYDIILLDWSSIMKGGLHIIVMYAHNYTRGIGGIPLSKKKYVTDLFHKSVVWY